jgi:Family of unknown function (DUF6299)
MRRLVMLAAVLVLAIGAPAAVSAAAPDNDRPGGAIALGPGLPQQFSQETSDATVTDDDFGCGSGGIDQATVWYSFTPAADGEVLIDATASGYAVGINVFEGTAAPETLFGCFGGSGSVFLQSGTTYYLMFADIDEDGVNGGTLDVLLDLPPPPLEVSLTIDSTGKIDRTGQVTISGTISCSRAADFAEVDLQVSQSVGRLRIHGFAFASAECDTGPTAWTASLMGENGTFAGGKVAVEANAFGCDPFSCAGDFATAPVRLRR